MSINITTAFLNFVKCLLCLCLGCFNDLSAQVGLSNYSQAPMLIHPSLVGSSGGRRASVAFGRMDDGIIYSSTSKSYYSNLYYDQLWKKLGSGIGGYFNVSKMPNDKGYENLLPYVRSRKHSMAMGVSIAPKYTLMSKKKPDKIRFTLSPSLSLNYNFAYTHLDINIPANNAKGLATDTTSYYNKFNHFTASAGGLLNSKVIMLGLALNYVLVNHQVKAQNTDLDEYYNTTMPRRHLFSTSVVFGFSLPRRENSLLGFSFVTKRSILLNASGNLQRFTNPSYGNMNLRVWKILFGTSMASSPVRSYEGLYLGYKAKKWKATVGLNHAQIYGSDTAPYYFGETTFMYNF